MHCDAVTSKMMIDHYFVDRFFVLPLFRGPNSTNAATKIIYKETDFCCTVNCQNSQVGMLQFRRRLLVSTSSTEHMVESRKGFIPLDARLQPIQPVNVDGVEGAVEPNH